MTTWVSRLLGILLSTGSVRWPDRLAIGVCSRTLKLLTRAAGILLEPWDRFDDATAVARPYVLDAALITTMTRLGNEALERYAEAVSAGLTGLSNLVLDTGKPINPASAER